MLEAIRNAFTLPDLRRKIVFTLLILVAYRAAAHVPIPGVDSAALQQFLESGSQGSTIVQFLNLLSGGALVRLSVMAMGVYPYITASIIMQLLTPLIPQLQELSKEGEQGRNKINMYTHWLAVPMALLQGYGQVIFIQSSIPGVMQKCGITVRHMKCTDGRFAKGMIVRSFIQAREDGSTTCRADGGCHKGIAETYPFCGKTIDDRCLDDGVAGATQGVIPLIVDK